MNVVRERYFGALHSFAVFPCEFLVVQSELVTEWHSRGPLIASYVIEDLSWRWSFWLAAIALAVSIALIFFCAPEVNTHSSSLVGNNS